MVQGADSGARTSRWKPLTPQVTGATLVVGGMPDGALLVEWWDTREGRVVHKNPAQVENGNVNLKIPPFAIDIAARITRTTE